MAKKRQREGPYRSKDMRIAIALIEDLYRKNILDVSNWRSFLTEKDINPSGFSKDKFDQIIKDLCSSALPIEESRLQLIWQGLFEKKSVGDRLFMYPDSKARLAQRTVNLLKKQDPAPRKILLAPGTTVYYMSRALLARWKELSLQEVYTNNIFVLSELIRHEKANIRVPEGIINLRDGSISSPDGFQGLKKKNLDAIVTSFFGLSFDQGFSSDHHYDKEEKMMNLRHETADHIYIIISWEKFGENDQSVAGIGDLVKGKTYYIITDPPNNWKDKQPQKVEEFNKWQELIDNGLVKFVFEYRD